MIIANRDKYEGRHMEKKNISYATTGEKLGE